MNKRIILGSEYPGLGDNLQLSTIPEIAKSLGYEVYVSNQNTYRNAEIKGLVWDLNPFIDGFVDEQTTIKWNEYKHVHGQVIKDVEQMIFGKVYSQEGKPKLYGIENLLNPIPYFKDRVVIDPNASTADNLPEDVFSNYHNPIVLNYTSDKYETYDTKSIANWLMVINSCKKFVCANSGGSPIAAAINKKADVYYKNSITHYKFNHNYIQL